MGSCSNCCSEVALAERRPEAGSSILGVTTAAILMEAVV